MAAIAAGRRDCRARAARARAARGAAVRPSTRRLPGIRRRGARDRHGRRRADRLRGRRARNRSGPTRSAPRSIARRRCATPQTPRSTPASSGCRGSSDDRVRSTSFAIRSGSGARSAVEVCRETLARIERLDPALHAFNTVTAEQALARAAELDRHRDRWTRRPAARRPGRAQGQPVHAGRPHDRLVADARIATCRRTTPPSWHGSRAPAR